MTRFTMTRIVKITHVDNEAKVFLDDGSELEGLISVSCNSTVNQLSTVRLEAYISPHKETAILNYININTGQRVSLTTEQADRFFDNRDPQEWRINR